MIRKAMKWSLITAAAVVVMGVLVGPDRLNHVAATARNHIHDNVDDLIDPQVKLTGEIRELQREYPKQIAELRTQLREVERSLTEVSDESEISTQVVKLCMADLQELEPRVAVTAIEDGEGGLATKTLRRRQEHILRTLEAYRSRSSLAVEEQVVLDSERGRIAVELASLEQEYTEFQSQIELLEREIESIARNEALIKIAKERRASEERRVDRRSRTALDRLYVAIQERRAEQAEVLSQLQQNEASAEYETRARLLLEEDAPQDARASQPGMF